VDGLGSVVFAADPTGAVPIYAVYSPWGEATTPLTELFGYTGRETGGGSWYYRARYYDAAHGRFLSEDPLLTPAGGSWYSYAANQPVMLTDPTGLKVFRCWRFLKIRRGFVGELLGALAFTSMMSFPPAVVPGSSQCRLHEYLWDSDTKASAGAGPDRTETGERGGDGINRDFCIEVPTAQGKCAMDHFESAKGTYHTFTNNCHNAVQNALDSCEFCKVRQP
jgi:RHS repeat-associated protein